MKSVRTSTWLTRMKHLFFKREAVHPPSPTPEPAAHPNHLPTHDTREDDVFPKTFYDHKGPK